MAKVARYAGKQLEIVNAVIATFRGETIWNADLAMWLHGQYPDIFPTPKDGNNFLEHVGLADFASAHKRGKDGQPLPLLGYAAFRGIRRHHADEPAHTEPRARYWVIPNRPYDRLLSKEEVFVRLGKAIPRPLPTKERSTEFYTKAV